MTRPPPLTAGRWLTLAIGVPVALALIAWTGLNLVALAGVGSYRVNLTVPVHGRAVVQGGAADVSVSPGQPGRMRVTGAVRYSLVQPDISWRRGPSSVTFHSGCDFPAGECSINLAVTVPPGGRPVVRLGSGALTARGLSGQVTLSSASGNVTATGISGRSAISASSGDVAVTGLSGSQAVLRDDSGNITGTGVASPDVTVSDQSGDITLTFSAVPDQVQVSDASGNITLVLPPGATRYRVNAVTAFGATGISVPRSATSPHVITVTDQSGDIAIGH
jgi:putative adhesin